MLKYLLCSFAFVGTSCFSQIVNSLSPDNTGFFTHALDTVISIIKQDEPITRIYVTGQACVHSYLPDRLQGIPIYNVQDHELRKVKGEASHFKIACLSIIKDEVKITILARKREGNGWAYLAAAGYQLHYYYDPETKLYFLKKIEQGFRL